MTEKPSAPSNREIMDSLRHRYVTSPRDAQLVGAFDYLLDRADILDATDESVAIEGRAVALLANSGAGKTRALRRMLTTHVKIPDFGAPSCPVVAVSAPAPCTLKTLGRAILRTLGYPLTADRREHEIWEMVHGRLDLLGTKILCIDEMQNVTANARLMDAARIRDTLKSLLNDPDYPICLLLSGLPELRDFLEADTQIQRRTRIVSFPTLYEGDLPVYVATVELFAKGAALIPDCKGGLAPRLHHASLGEYGIGVEMVLDAIDIALTSGSKTLDRENFATMFARRTGNSAAANPFVADNWRAIDCRLILMNNPYERDKPTEPQPPKRGKKR